MRTFIPIMPVVWVILVSFGCNMPANRQQPILLILTLLLLLLPCYAPYTGYTGYAGCNGCARSSLIVYIMLDGMLETIKGQSLSALIASLSFWVSPLCV